MKFIIAGWGLCSAGGGMIASGRSVVGVCLVIAGIALSWPFSLKKRGG
ncbi:hypothetical protein [Aquabacter sp. CN5-332]